MYFLKPTGNFKTIEKLFKLKYLKQWLRRANAKILTNRAIKSSE